MRRRSPMPGPGTSSTSVLALLVSSCDENCFTFKEMRFVSLQVGHQQQSRAMWSPVLGVGTLKLSSRAPLLHRKDPNDEIEPFKVLCCRCRPAKPWRFIGALLLAAPSRLRFGLMKTPRPNIPRT